MRNTFYTYYTHPKDDPTGLAKFGVRAKSVKQAIENWQFTKEANNHELFMVQKCEEVYV